MNSIRNRAFSYALTISSSASAFAGTPTLDDLRFRPAAEQSVSYILSRHQVIKSSGDGGPPTEKTSHTTIGVAVKPVNWANGSGTLKFTVTSIAFRTEQSGLTMDFDSSKEPNGELEKSIAPMAKELIGADVVAEIGPDGTVKSIEGAAKIAANPLGQQMLTAMTRPPSFQRQWWPIFSTRAPEGMTDAGKGWKSSDDDTVSRGLDCRLSNEHSVSKHDDGIATVAVSGTLQLPPLPANAPIKAELGDSSFTSTQLWNTREGRLASFSAEQEVSINMDMKGQKRVMTLQDAVEITPGK